jgi:hypothetical protein
MALTILGFIKTKEERRMERNIQVKQWLSQLRREIKTAQKNEADYIAKARLAHRKGFGDQFALLKANIRRVRARQTALERQILLIETAMQTQAEMESNKIFAESMNAISKSISGLFNAQDIAKMEANFEKAALQAQSVEESTKNFIESFTSDMVNPDVEPGDDTPDEELERLIFAGDRGQSGEKSEEKFSSTRDELLEELEALEKNFKSSRK